MMVDGLESSGKRPKNRYRIREMIGAMIEGTAKRVHLAKQSAAIEYDERRSELVVRVVESVGRVFDSLYGPGKQDAIFWNLSMTRDVGRWEIIDKPALFIESLRSIYGAATQTLEAVIVEELRKEFALESPARSSKDDNPEGPDSNPNSKQERFVDVLERITNASSLQ